MDNQNSPSQQRFWSLLSKKLSKEASDDELQELHSILLGNPTLHHQADLITEMWEQGAGAANHANEAAYMRHVMKHRDEFFTDGPNEDAYPVLINEEQENEKSKLPG